MLRFSLSPQPRPVRGRGLALLIAFAITAAAAEPEPLFDWSASETYRSAVTHPSGAIKPADVERAREKIRRHAWAQSYAAAIEKSARGHLSQLTPAFIAAMIPETTPGDSKFTPCPACRDQGKPVHPHGLWSWRVSAPDQLTCDMCHTVFPNERYPETIGLTTRGAAPQTLTYCGGEPFVIFSYKTGRPSFSANIRARKVSYMASLCHSLAEAHLLTGKTEYARAVRDVLLRFAACYPRWLVHTGYGEYSDLEPRVAAQFINQLPEPELCPPPNKPDRRLHTGYWTAGRATGSGQESGFIRRMVESYDQTCTAVGPDGAAVFSDAERRQIERDLLLEGTLLLVSDKQINNKSVGNRTAAALVGLCVGHPGLVRFGWEGFQRTVDGWFLADGTTSESPAYALMTLSNIWELPQAMRGYTDPRGYTPAAGARLDQVAPYQNKSYARGWQAMFNGLRGDLRYPSYADSYPRSSLGGHFVELMVANYPDRPEYRALLHEVAGAALAPTDPGVALYYRDPGLAAPPAGKLAFADWCPEELRIAHMRSGSDGREGLLLLSASHWGNHHHVDSLNLSYWKSGAEVLSDLGYLWDHPRKSQTTRTVAHNTVVIDEKDQTTRERGGEILFFRTSEHVKVTEATSRAYAAAGTYRRTSALIEHGDGRNYVIDFFRVQGGSRQDYVFHASAPACRVEGLALASAPAAKFYDFSNVRMAEAPHTWRVRWENGPLTCVAWNLGQPGERAFVADGWGQRDWKNSDLGATLPYIVRRSEGSDARLFVSVFEAHGGAGAFVRDVKVVDRSGTIAIETALGTDYVRSDEGSGTLAAAGTQLTGRFAAMSVQGGRVAWTFVEPAQR